MQKTMFENCRYGLEQAVIDPIKTMTRRLAKLPKGIEPDDVTDVMMGIDKKGRVYFTLTAKGRTFDIYPKFQIGEEVAVAQSYKDAGIDPYEIVGHIDEGQNMFTLIPAHGSKGWQNKMYVRADLMPYRIRIKDIKLERLQDISEEDCLREGITKWMDCYIVTGIMERGKKNNVCFDTPRKAFAALIDRISGRGTWKKNPWVFAYTFELVK